MIDYLKQEEDQKKMVTNNTQYKNYCDFVKNLIDTDLALYGEWQEKYADMLNHMFSLSNKSVLDIGCAYGAQLHGIYNHTQDVCGCDVNQKSIDESPFPELKGKIVHSSPIDVRLKFPNKKFDFIHSHMVFEHFPSWGYTEDLMNEINYMLSKDGVLYAVLVAGRHDTEEEIIERYKGGEKIDLTHVNVWPIEQWHSLLQAIGLINIEEYVKPIQMVYITPNKLSFHSEYHWDQLIYSKSTNNNHLYIELFEKLLQKQQTYNCKEYYRTVINENMPESYKAILKKYM